MSFSCKIGCWSTFYVPTKKIDELRVVTKLFDIVRDAQLTCFCSNLIHNMIFYRRIAFKFENDKDRFRQFEVRLFSKEQVDKIRIHNVKIQDLIHTIKKVEKILP